jgi:hypothetical protein
MAKTPPQAAAKNRPSSKKEDASALPLKEIKARIRGATGTDDTRLQSRLFSQVLSGTWLQSGQEENVAIIAALAALEAIAPADGLEGMLATQMVATHEAAMECMRRAMLSEQTFAGRDVNLKHAEKLLQIYARQMEALDKHRGRGQQKITVEHVHVHAGGQAIVGNVQGRAPARESSAASLALSDQTGDVVPLPDPLSAPKGAKQAARKSSK